MGLAGTFTSFIILGNYGLAQQMKHGIDISGMLLKWRLFCSYFKDI